MPKVTVYVRKDDYPKWKAVEEKTELIHQALAADIMTSKYLEAGGDPELIVMAAHDYKKNFEQIVTKDGAEIARLPLKLCKHGADHKFCKFAKPGKPCK